MSAVPGTMFFESVVRNEERGMTLLDMLSARFAYHSKEAWKERISGGFVTLNGTLATSDQTLSPKDRVTYRVENYSEPDVPTDFETLYADDEFLVLSKPAGIPVHHTGRIFYNTFTGVVRRAFENEEISPMHRLDRDTGGIMLLARDRDTARRFEKSLEHILLRKIYVAIVRGEFPENDIVCEKPLREDPESEIRIRMFPKDDGKPCRTAFRRIAVLEGESERFSVLAAELFTGRKHQIRAHLAFLGFPIVGDKLYSHDGKFYKKQASEHFLSEDDYRILGAHTQMLFAYSAQIRLPGREAVWMNPSRLSPEMEKLLCGMDPKTWDRFWKTLREGPVLGAKRAH